MQYLMENGASAGAAATAKVATGATIKTMMQIKTVIPCRIFEWGCSFDASAAATPGQVELIETVAVFATVTAYVTNDITRYDGEALLFGDPTTALISVGTSASGFTASIEGSVIAPVRKLSGSQQIAPTNQFIEQFPLGYRPLVQSAVSQRIRATFGTTVNMQCYEIIEF